MSPCERFCSAVLIKNLERKETNNIELLSSTSEAAIEFLKHRAKNLEILSCEMQQVWVPRNRSYLLTCLLPKAFPLLRHKAVFEPEGDFSAIPLRYMARGR